MPPTDTKRAYELIKDKIITIAMQPGSVINEATLMAETGLGRTPIREALKRLEAARLVTVSPRRGMFVTTINISDLGQIQEIRSVLDPLCVRLAIQRATAAEKAELRNLVNQAQAASVNGDVTALMDLDCRFHHLLAKATHNDLLIAENEMLYDLARRIWHFYLDRLNPDDLAFDALEEIISGLEASEVTTAEQAVMRHIVHFGNAIRKCL
jgi:DNA-binding GntR family transcriptional regulator